MNVKIVACVLVMAGMMAVSEAAGIHTTELRSTDAPAGFAAGAVDAKVLFTGRSDMGVVQTFLDMGLLGANSFVLDYKDGDTVKYAWIGDIRLGEQGLARLGIKGSMPVISAQGKDLEKSSLPAVADCFNRGQANILAPYTVKEPLRAVKKGIYEGLLQVTVTEKNVPYRETLHVVLYDNIYFGPTLRVLAVATDDDALLWPKLKQMMKVEK